MEGECWGGLGKSDGEGKGEGGRVGSGGWRLEVRREPVDTHAVGMLYCLYYFFNYLTCNDGKSRTEKKERKEKKD